jgi:hypothetical protein
LVYALPRGEQFEYLKGTTAAARNHRLQRRAVERKN